VGIASIARLDQADVIISDRHLDRSAQELLGDTVRELLLVDVAGADDEVEPEPAMPIQVVAAAGTGSRAH
jgi:hypothetical protein